VNERWLTLLFALAALACFYLLLFPHAGADQEQSLPVSSEAGADGYLASWRWLQAARIPLASLRRRYDRLDDVNLTPAASGNLLITTLPQRLSLELAEYAALKHWVARGNTLLIMAALDDTPRFGLTGDSQIEEALERMAGLHVVSRKDSVSFRPWLAPQPLLSVPQGQHPLLAGVSSVQAVSDYPTAIWIANTVDASMPLALAHLVETQQAATTAGDDSTTPAEQLQPPTLWVKGAGHGQIIVSAFATPFTNQQLDRGDNARLLANIIAWSRSGDGRVIFDDAHQGLVDLYDPAAFFHDPRLYRTLGWLLLLWLAFVLGPQRLRRAADDWHGIDETALIRASGRFFSAAVAAPEAARELLANFFNGLRRRLGLREDGEPIWEWLDTQAALSRSQLATLREFYTRSLAEERVDLPRLHNFLTTLQGQLM
jgi:uncharacterized protein DUF4350